MIEKEFILYTVRSAIKKQSYYNRASLVGAWVRLTIGKYFTRQQCVNCFLVCLWEEKNFVISNYLNLDEAVVGKLLLKHSPFPNNH
jgi:hypothetical protein